MAEIKVEYPFVDSNGNKKDNLIKYYAEDKEGIKYYIKQVETGIIYDSAVDVYPSRYTYVPTNKKIEEVKQGE